MDLLQVFIYVALAIIYFMFKAFGDKSKQNKAPGGSPLDTEEPLDSPRRQRGPTTFEELLGELDKREQQPATGNTATKKAEEAGRSVREVAERKYQEGKREVEAKTKQLNKTIRQERKRLTVEKEPEAPTPEKNIPRYENRASRVNYDIPEQADYEGLDDKRQRFTPFETEKPPAIHPVAALFQNAQSARTAFLLSEILKRKY
jgi:FtsZ-interacting cell division protein ZipA